MGIPVKGHDVTDAAGGGVIRKMVAVKIVVNGRQSRELVEGG